MKRSSHYKKHDHVSKIAHILNLPVWSGILDDQTYEESMHLKCGAGDVSYGCTMKLERIILRELKVKDNLSTTPKILWTYYKMRGREPRKTNNTGKSRRKTTERQVTC